MIYGFAKQSNGQVRLSSEIGVGTTARIYLPRHQGDAVDDEGIQPELSQAARAEAGDTVLIVDDEPSVRMLVTEVLGELGYTAIEAADSVSGLKVLQSDVRIDLLITDVGLPGGMNGRQMTDAARQHRPKLKVLFITGYAENAAISNGHLEPGMHVLTKHLRWISWLPRSKTSLREARYRGAMYLHVVQNPCRPCENPAKGIPARRDTRLESGMSHIIGHDRSQTLLLPESLDEYVGAENPVRFIDAFIDGLDLTAAGFIRETPKGTGRPGYAPKDLLKLYVYGYLNRVRSSRRLEAESHRNIEVIWLLRHLKPDFKTIADFRRVNHNAFRPIFR
jgi:transposase/CheY-like chemotaxis protein